MSTAAGPALIAVAPNGARRQAGEHPALPLTPAELAACARDCVTAGAALLHLHVRDAAGAHTLDVAAYRAAMAAIRAEVGDALVLQATTEAVGRYRPHEQMAMVRALQPEAVSVALRELCPVGGEDAARDFYRWAAAAGIALQHILYDADEVRRFRRLCADGVVPGPAPFVLFVLGRYAAGQVSEPADLLPFLAAWDHAGPWMVCAFGAAEARCAAAALALGGHVRVGFENNTRLADGAPAPDNAALVRQSAGLAAGMGRARLDAAGARRLGRPAP